MLIFIIQCPIPRNSIHIPLLAFNKSVPAGDTASLAESVSYSVAVLYKPPTISTAISFHYLLHHLKHLS